MASVNQAASSRMEIKMGNIFWTLCLISLLPAPLLAQTAIYESCEDGPDTECWGFPEGCESTQSCTLFATWTPVDGGATYEFEAQAAYGDVNSGDRYVAVGFSASRSMEAAAVVLSSQAVTPVSQLYWNYGYATPEKIVASANVVDSQEVREGEGYLYVRFTRPASMTFISAVDGEQTNDLSFTPYYLLLASGEMDNDGVPLEHDVKDVSSQKISFSGVTTTSTTTTTTQGGGGTVYGNFEYSTCGSIKTCFGFYTYEDTASDGSCVQTQDCNLVASWKTNFQDSSLIDFEMQMVATPGESPVNELTYVAMGFSSDQEMGYELVTMGSIAFGPHLGLYQNTDHSYPVPIQYFPKFDQAYGQAEGQYLYVEYSLPTALTYTDPTTDAEATLDLAGTCYYLLMASEHVELDGGSFVPKRHGSLVGFSDFPINFAGADCTGTGN